MKNKLILILIFLAQLTFAQDPLAQYVREGLENNLALKQKEASFQRSMEALKEAKGLFFPNISLNARYSVAQGGRTIDLPIGDLLNPVYATLNQLLQQNLYPSIDNQSFMFFRPQEHETKIRVIQPLFNTDIYYNSIIKKELVNTEKFTIEQFKLELTAEIKKAWYQVAMADGVLSVMNNTLGLVQGNLRVNQKLFENDKITKDILYRSEQELIKFEQNLVEADKNKKLASAYLNFLVNRPLDDSIDISEPAFLPQIPESVQMYTQSAIQNRKEIQRLESLGQINDYQIKMNQAGALPDLMIVGDYGFQGENYKFNKDADFAQVSALLRWDLFSGFQNRAKVRQAVINKQETDAKTEEVKKQIELQVMNANLELNNSARGILAAEAVVKSAREGFKLVKRKYDEGMASLIEFIDARTELTEAEESLIISRYQYLSDYAEFEKTIANNNIL